MAPALAKRLGHLLLRVPEFIHQLTITRRFLDRVQVGPLDVFDDRNFEHFDIGELAHNDRKAMYLRDLRSPPAPLTSDNLEVTIVQRTHDQGLNDPLFLDRCGEIVQMLLLKPFTRLIWVWLDPFNRNELLRRRGPLGGHALCLSYIRHQCRKPPAKAPFTLLFICHTATLLTIVSR